MKKDYKKKLVEGEKNFSKEEKGKKSNAMVMNVTKISQKIKTKVCRLQKRKIIECEKMPHYNYEKLLFQKVMTEKKFLFGCLKL